MKIFTVLGLVCLLFSESNAMSSNDKSIDRAKSPSKVVFEQKQPIMKPISTEVSLFVVQISSNPPIEIIKLRNKPYRLILDGLFVSPILSMHCGSFYKGIEIKYPLFLTSNMDNNSILDIITRAFSPNKCNSFVDTISMKTLTNRFPYLMLK